jgi:hypothetical protein
VEQSELLKLAAQALERLQIPYALVGSFASGIWGETRFTQDIDIVIDLHSNRVESLCSAFPESEFYVSLRGAKEAIARHGQFNVIHPSSGNKIDFMVAGGSSWTLSQLERGKRVQVFDDQLVSVAAPDDVILGKLIYYGEGGSDKHLRDIAGILKISGELVDRDYVAKHAAEFGVADVWQAVLDQIDN